MGRDPNEDSKARSPKAKAMGKPGKKFVSVALDSSLSDQFAARYATPIAVLTDYTACAALGLEVKAKYHRNNDSYVVTIVRSADSFDEGTALSGWSDSPLTALCKAMFGALVLYQTYAEDGQAKATHNQLELPFDI